MTYRSIVFAAAVMAAAAVLAEVHPSFDPKDVVCQVRRDMTARAAGVRRQLSDISDRVPSRRRQSAAGREPFALDDGEFLIDTSGTHPERRPALALGDAGFLVVWQDFRGDTARVCGSRLSPDGTVLDSSGIAISTAAGSAQWPAAARCGPGFFVAWTDYRNGGADIYGARVSSAGVVLDPQGIVISAGANSEFWPALAFDGENVLVVWSDYRSGLFSDVYGARVTPGGVVLDPQGIPVSTAADEQWHPAPGFDGVNYFVAWTEYRNGFYTDIYGARLTPAGAVLDPSGIAVSAAADNQQDPAIAFGGANFLVAWTDRRNGSPDVFAARVTPGGLTLDPSGIALSTPADMQRYPTVAFDGGDFVVTWEDERGGLIDLSGARVTAAGAVLDTGPVITQEGSQCFPALACAAAGPPLLAYQGWAGVVGGKTYNADRIWGKLNPSPGVEETENREVRREDAGATIVRGVLTLGTATGFPRGNRMAVPQPVLLDATGRKVMTLAPGANDVRQLAPGVYFVRQDSGLGKIMIAR